MSETSRHNLNKMAARINADRRKRQWRRFWWDLRDDVPLLLWTIGTFAVGAVIWFVYGIVPR